MMDFDDNSDREEDDEYGEEEEEEEEIGPEDYHLDDMLDKDLNWELEVRSEECLYPGPDYQLTCRWPRGRRSGRRKRTS